MKKEKRAEKRIRLHDERRMRMGQKPAGKRRAGMLVAATAVALAGTLALAGCGRNDMDGHAMGTGEMSMSPIEVTLNITPESPHAGDTLHMEAVVTQDGQAVDDAKAVLFEAVGGNDNEVKAKADGEWDRNGVYTGEIVLSEPGDYRIISHVTARTQHSMPAKEVTVLPE